MGDGDQWPAILDKIKTADVLMLARPTWMGNPSSLARLLQGAQYPKV